MITAGVLSTTLRAHGVEIHSDDQSAGKSVSVNPVLHILAPEVPVTPDQIHAHSHSTKSIAVEIGSERVKESQPLLSLRHSVLLKHDGESVFSISTHTRDHEYVPLKLAVSFTTTRYHPAEIVTPLRNV